MTVLVVLWTDKQTIPSFEHLSTLDLAIADHTVDIPLTRFKIITRHYRTRLALILPAPVQVPAEKLACATKNTCVVVVKLNLKLGTTEH